MASRSQRAAVASETVSILEAGGYTHPESGRSVDFREALETATRETEFAGQTDA